LYQEYLDILSGHDYQKRPHEKISKWVKQTLGFSTQCTSQDAVTSAIFNKLNMVRVSTFARNATYIGRTGIHFTPEQYDSGYYGKDKIADYKNNEQFNLPSKDTLINWIQDIRRTGRI
jgi:hypothetical protein